MEQLLYEATALLNQVLEIRRRTSGQEHSATTSALAALGRLHLQARKFGEAESLLRAAQKNYDRLAVHTWQHYRNQGLLGFSLAGQGEYAEAEPLVLSGYRGMMEREAAIPAEERSSLKQAVQQIVQLYEDWGKPDKATEWRQKLAANPGNEALPQ